jgi:hypothetical protein
VGSVALRQDLIKWGTLLFLVQPWTPAISATHMGPQAIEAKYNMRSSFEWDRFIRFMDR